VYSYCPPLYPEELLVDQSPSFVKPGAPSSLSITYSSEWANGARMIILRNRRVRTLTFIFFSKNQGFFLWILFLRVKSSNYSSFSFMCQLRKADLKY
jgi:hypothetical protein